MTKLPPPIEMSPNEPPSYFRGHLYYYDPDSSNAMHWVLYNGQAKMRFVSRTALENYVLERQATVPERAVGLLMRAYARTQRAYQDLDEAAAMLDGSTRPDVEGTALQLRRLTDIIDRITATLIRP